MIMDIQKAYMGKRIIAWLFDSIMLVILVMLLASVLSDAMGYDAHLDKLDSQYALYEKEYGVSFEITQEAYDAMSKEQQAEFDDAYLALSNDPDTVYAYNMLLSMSLLIASLAILGAYLLTEFLVPLLLRNGQTIGKKVFGVALMRKDGIKISPVILFIRTILGKMAIGTMIPLMMLFMMYWGTIGVVGPAVLIILVAAQLCLVIFTRNRTTIHDLLAKTVAVDMSSQMIFDSEEERIAYEKELQESFASNRID